MVLTQPLSLAGFFIHGSLKISGRQAQFSMVDQDTNL